MRERVDETVGLGSGSGTATTAETQPEPAGGGARAARCPAPIEVGGVIAERYEIERILGEGGAGRVFRAIDRTLGQPVALKVLRPERASDRSWIRRLAREVRVARAIQHPNVCRVYELGREGGQWFVTMELADGGTLREVLQARNGVGAGAPLDEERLAEARALCAGLAAIHAVGICHRDVTPQNVLRMRDGRLVLSDFGLAVGPGENTTFDGGTPHYMAPEVLAGGRADRRSDVWQLGLVLHQILFGRRAEWDHEGERVLLRAPVCEGVGAVEEELAELCAECLSHNPAGRPATAVEVAGRLAAAERARPRRWPARLAARARRLARRPAVHFGALALVLAAAAGGVGRAALRTDPCAAGAARAEAAWGAPAREAVHAAFARSGHPRASETFAAVASLLDGRARRWTAAYADACQATHVRGEQSPEVLDLRMACLDEELDATGAVVRVLGAADRSIVDHAVEAAGGLGDVARCADVRQLRAGVHPPRDPRARAEVEALRPALQEAAALLETEQYARAAAAADRVYAAADRIGYCPMQADALLTRGETAIITDPRAATSLIERALALAESCAHDRAVARAATELVYLNRNTDWPAAERWYALADAVLKRIGGDPRLQSWLANNLGSLRDLQGRTEEARQAFESAVQMKTALLGPDHPDVALSLANLADVLRTLGRGPEALTTADRALAIEERWYGGNSAAVAYALVTKGELLIKQSRLDEAEQVMTRALHIMTTELPVDSAAPSYALAGLGNVALARGDAATAVSLLERALAMREAHDSTPFELAESRFALARALARDGRDRARSRPQALALARAALATYANAPAFERRAAEVRVWLKE
jgi:tetratricopeptide (TPR) repeat protein